MCSTTIKAPATGAVGSGAVAHGTAGEAAGLLVETFLGAVPVRIALWDGTSVGTDDATCTIRLRAPDALRRVLWSPGDLGVARAFVAGDIEVDGERVRGNQGAAPGGREPPVRVADDSAHGCRRPAPRRRRLGPWRLHLKRHDLEAYATPRDATLRWSVITTTSATTSTGSCWAVDDLLLRAIRRARHVAHRCPGLQARSRDPSAVGVRGGTQLHVAWALVITPRARPFGRTADDGRCGTADWPESFVCMRASMPHGLRNGIRSSCGSVLISTDGDAGHRGALPARSLRFGKAATATRSQRGCHGPQYGATWQTSEQPPLTPGKGVHHGPDPTSPNTSEPDRRCAR